MNELEAAVGIGNLDIYDDLLERRRGNLYYLIDKFEEFKPYRTKIKKEDHEEIGQHALLIVVDTAASFNRSELTAHVEKTELIPGLFLVLCQRNVLVLLSWGIRSETFQTPNSLATMLFTLCSSGPWKERSGLYFGNTD